MPDVCRSAPTPRARIDKRGLARLAARQYGVLSRGQLALAASGSTLSRWVAEGRLHRIHPGVYALGHESLSLQGRLIAALLYAGPSAALSHTTAAWAWQLVETEPRRVHVTVPGRRHSLPDVRVHHSGRVEAAELRGLQVTTVGRTLVDLAAMLPASKVRRALAEAEYRKLLDLNEVGAALAGRRHGSLALREALANHLPELAQTLSVLEERFLELCESAGLPVPEVNGRVGRMRVDALWRGPKVAVELDGAAAHGGWAAISRDRKREMALRAKGFQVARYTWDQVTETPSEVAADVRRLLDDKG